MAWIDVPEPVLHMHHTRSVEAGLFGYVARAGSKGCLIQTGVDRPTVVAQIEAYLLKQWNKHRASNMTFRFLDTPPPHRPEAEPSTWQMVYGISESALFTRGGKDEVIEYRLKPLEHEATEWSRFSAMNRRDARDPLEVATVLPVIHNIINGMPFDYAAGGIDQSFMELLQHHHPNELAWPLLIIDPHQITTWTRDHLLKTPAHTTTSLDTGHIWIQATKNPFMATRKELTPIAKHLDLDAPP